MLEQQHTRETEIDRLVDEMDRADIALAVHLERTGTSENPVRDLLETRAAILRWCADPFVAHCFDRDCVRATAAGVHAMTLKEFAGYVQALRHLVRVGATRARGVA